MSDVCAQGGRALPSRSEIVAFLASVLAREAEIAAPLREETELLAELKLGSIQQLSLVVAVENHYRICFEPEDEAAIGSLGSVVDVILARLADREGQAEPASS